MCPFLRISHILRDKRWDLRIAANKHWFFGLKRHSVFGAFVKTIQMRTCPAFRYGRTYPPPRALRRKRLQNGMPEPASATMRKQFLFPFRFFPFKRPAPFANTALSLRAVSCAVPACGACLLPFGPRSVPIRCLRLRCVCRPLPVRLFAFCAYIIS